MAIILVVDDRPTNRQFLVTLLGYWGHQLLEAADGAEALALVRAERPALVITDILMPTMDGFEFVRRLRADPAVTGTAVIFYSAEYQRAEVQALARAGGVVDYLTKPAEPEEILRAVDKLLGTNLAPAVSTPAEDFDREHLRLLTDKLARRVDQLELAHRRQAAVAELGQRALACADLSTLMEDTVALIARTLNVDSCQILEFQPGGNALRVRAGVGWKGRLIGRETVGAGDDSRAGYPLPCREPVIVEDCRAEVRSGDPATRRDPGLINGLSVVIPGHNRPFGVLGAQATEHCVFDREESDFLRAVANVLAAGIERRRAEAALEENAERLRELTRRLLGVQEAERRRIARELHDEVGQCLTAAKMALDHVARDQWGPDVGRRVDDAAAMTAQALDQVRNLSRLLRPSLLDDLGLPEALRALVESVAERVGLSADLELDDVGPIDPDLETACYRIAQEALTNSVKHAGATRLRVVLHRIGDELELIVEDDGIGFDVTAATVQAVRGSSLGVLSLQERGILAGGRTEIISRPGGGTRVRTIVPAVGRPAGRDAGEEGA
jgi:signal transduction histidine kinase/CheY-like chemotaxis protein